MFGEGRRRRMVQLLFGKTVKRWVTAKVKWLESKSSQRVNKEFPTSTLDSEDPCEKSRLFVPAATNEINN